MFGRWKKSDAGGCGLSTDEARPIQEARGGLWLLAYGTVLDYPRRYAATPYLPQNEKHMPLEARKCDEITQGMGGLVHSPYAASLPSNADVWYSVFSWMPAKWKRKLMLLRR